MAPKCAEPSGDGYETTLDVVVGLHTMASALRSQGWEVDMALTSGLQEQITFAAQRPQPEKAV